MSQNLEEVQITETSVIRYRWTDDQERCLHTKNQNSYDVRKINRVSRPWISPHYNGNDKFESSNILSSNQLSTISSIQDSQ
jgi:hypothetical protein